MILAALLNPILKARWSIPIDAFSFSIISLPASAKYASFSLPSLPPDPDAGFPVVAILALSVVGSYSISSSLMDVLSMAACGLLGYVLVRYKYGVAPMALGLILGTTMEEGFKLSLHLGAAEGNIMLFFFSRPQSLALIILTLLSLGYSIWKECGAKKV